MMTRYATTRDELLQWLVYIATVETKLRKVRIAAALVGMADLYGGATASNQDIEDAVEIGINNVSNYVSGMIKDGFLEDEFEPSTPESRRERGHTGPRRRFRFVL